MVRMVWPHPVTAVLGLAIVMQAPAGIVGWGDSLLDKYRSTRDDGPHPNSFRKPTSNLPGDKVLLFTWLPVACQCSPQTHPPCPSLPFWSP